MRPTELTQDLIDKMRPEDRKEMNLLTSEEQQVQIDKGREKYENKLEKEIQNMVEAYLVQLGYERRTSENIGRGMPRSGWFIHLHAAKRNPILLDILVLANSTPRQYLELEIKTQTGSVRVEQEALIAQGASLARSVEESCAIIRHWHEALVSRSDGGQP